MSSSSDDLLADRRFAWAKGMADDGDFAAAADLFAQIVERVPGWAPGWAGLAEARERNGDPAGAREAWARVAEHDRAEILGAAAHLARLDGHTPAALPGAYVRALFDDYAPRFDRHLVATLDYRGPAVLDDALGRAAPGRHFDRALDLGCGTGLMGLAMAGRASRIEGVDLSPAMVERARATGAYAVLSAGSLEEALAAADPASYDLVVAADVLVYVGDLAPVFRGAARVLRPGGVLGFTVQAHGGSGFVLGSDMRFSHGGDHVAEALTAEGFRGLALDAASTRREKGAAVPGFVVVAER